MNGYNSCTNLASESEDEIMYGWCKWMRLRNVSDVCVCAAKGWKPVYGL